MYGASKVAEGSGMVFPLLKKTRKLPWLPGKVYMRVLERRIWLVVKPQIEDERGRFCADCETPDFLYALTRVLEGTWVRHAFSESEGL